MAQLVLPPLTVCCFSKIEIGFTFLVPAHPGSPGKRAVKRVCVCVLSVKRTGNKLSEACFTFSRETIYHEPCEKVRYAGRSRGRHVPTRTDQKQHSKLTDKEGLTDNVDSAVPRKKAKQSETGLLLAKRSGTDDMLPQLAAESRRPKSIMILPDADILEHEIAEKQNPETESTVDMAEDLCIPKATRTDFVVEERFGFCLFIIIIIIRIIIIK